MAKDKYDFMLNLLERGKLTSTQTERFLMLLSKELKKETFVHKKLLERVERIEKQIKLAPLIIKNDSNTGVIIHKPIKTVELLNKFTEDTKLKYTTHIWDKDSVTREGVINRKYFAEGIKKEFYREYSFRSLENIGLKSLYNIIWGFTVGPNKYGWGRYKLNFGWYNKDLIAYYLSSNENNPFNYVIPKDYLPDKKIKGKTLKYFEDFVEIFKSEIEFRSNELFNILNKKFDFGFEYNLEISETIKGKSLYTYTQGVENALDLIASNIKHRSDKNKHIQISSEYNVKSKYLEISITDFGSYSNSRVDNPKLTFKENKGQMKSIRDNLISLCDFSIISNFEKDDKLIPLELEYLNKNRPEINEDEEQFIIRADNVKANGFTYKLKFYV